MIKRLIALLAALLMLIPLSACTQQNSFSKTYLDVFDTSTVITGYGVSQEKFKDISQKLHEELQNCHRLFDIYNSYDGINNLKTVNDNAGVAPVAVDAVVIGLLCRARELYDITGGAMNIAMGSVLSLWHDYRENGSRLPKNSELKRAARHINIDSLIIDKKNKTVFLSDAGASIDVGAVAKGYACDIAKNRAKQLGLTSGIINIGGNVGVIGGKNGGGFTIGLQNPSNTSENMHKISVTDTSVVTSGDYQRFYEVGGVRYCHIINPQTLFPARYYKSVTVVCADSALADALSTALFVTEYDKATALLAKLENCEALFVMSDGEQRSTDGFSALLAD